MKTVEGIFKPSQARVQRQLSVWEGRLGQPAVEALEQGKILFRTAYVGAVSMVALFITFTLLHAPYVALTCIVLAFAIEIPTIAWSIVCLIRMERLVRSRCGLKEPLRPPLSFRVLRSPTEFDRWVLVQKGLRQTQ
jgi:hypothetical protein